MNKTETRIKEIDKEIERLKKEKKELEKPNYNTGRLNWPALGFHGTVHDEGL